MLWLRQAVGGSNEKVYNTIRLRERGTCSDLLVNFENYFAESNMASMEALSWLECLQAHKLPRVKSNSQFISALFPLTVSRIPIEPIAVASEVPKAQEGVLILATSSSATAATPAPTAAVPPVHIAAPVLGRAELGYVLVADDAGCDICCSIWQQRRSLFEVQPQHRGVALLHATQIINSLPGTHKCLYRLASDGGPEHSEGQELADTMAIVLQQDHRPRAGSLCSVLYRSGYRAVLFGELC